MLAPTSKHDYISIDFWAALNDISKIKSWNWGGYVLKNLFQAVRKYGQRMEFFLPVMFFSPGSFLQIAGQIEASQIA